jgi:hypothetical protein
MRVALQQLYVQSYNHDQLSKWNFFLAGKGSAITGPCYTALAKLFAHWIRPSPLNQLKARFLASGQLLKLDLAA